MPTASTPRIDTIETKVSGLSTSLQSSVVNLTYRTATTTTGTPASGVFYSTVVGRAPIVDFSNDLRPRMGVERVMTQSLMEVQGETGPNGERVFKPINDTMDAVRFVGNWGNLNDTNGLRIGTTTVNDYVEITFYGTGLNLVYFNDGSRTFSGLLNGVTSLGSFGSGQSGVLSGRNYTMNLVQNVTSNLTLGIHTVKLSQTGSAFQVAGYEVLNEASTIKTAPGTASVNGKLLTLGALDSQAYNTTFDAQYQNGGTSPSDLTRGGRVVVYQKTDGTIGKSITWTNTAPAYLTSANHANESVIRTYNWREFGASRNTANAGQTADDFSSLTSSPSARAFTLDDGTTTLLTNNGIATGGSNQETLRMNANGDFITFTFIGTGLDVLEIDSAAGGTDSYTVSIDGATAIALASAGVAAARTVKIVSGLPYGTHTVRFNRVTANTFAWSVAQFIVYGPAKPALPSGAIELADYYLMANYTFNSAGSYSGNESKNSNGILAKPPTREATYSGTWTIPAVNGAFDRSGLVTQSSTAGNYIEYTFFGTGIEALFTYTTTLTINVLIDGVAPASAASVFGGSYTNPTWTLSDNANGSKIAFTGLALTKHTIRLTINTVSGGTSFSGFNVITPIHAPKNNTSGVIQNTLSVGSCGMLDTRVFNSQQIPTQKAWAQAIGISSAILATTSSLPIADMSVTIKTTGNPVSINVWSNFLFVSTNKYVRISIFVNGAQVGPGSIIYNSFINAAQASIGLTVPLPAGTHKIDVYQYGDGTNVTAHVDTNNGRVLTVREL